MNEINNPLREGVILGLEHAERLLKMFPIETAVEAIKDYRASLEKQIKPEMTSERIPEDLL
jgi:hypothetical protein